MVCKYVRAQGFASWVRLLLCLAIFGVGSFGVPFHAHAGTIAGVVKFRGVPPELPEIKATKDQDYCGDSVPDETYIIGQDGSLGNAVVYLEKIGSHPGSSRREHRLDNSRCRFVPRVIAMMQGEKLIVHNSDPKLHIVHSYLEKRTVFNLSLPFRGLEMEVTQRIKGPGMLQVNCDSHAWMRGYIYVFDHPFFAVTGEQGSFFITDIPAGIYTLTAWHERAGVRSQEVRVLEKGETQVRFEFGPLNDLRYR